MRTATLILATALLGLFFGCLSPSNEDAMSRAERLRQAADPQAAQWLVEAQQAFRQGAFNSALLLTDSAMHAAPRLPDLHFLRARIFTEMQRPDLAEAAYRRVLEQDPTYRGAWMNLGNAAFRQGAYGRALERYRNEFERHPSPSVLVAIGSTYEEQRQPDSARYAYEQAIELDSAYASAYMHLGQLHKSRGTLDEAVAVSRRGVQLDSDNVDYQYALGSLLVSTGEAEEAIPHLTAVLEERPWHYWATYSLSQAFARLGRHEDAQHVLDRAKHLQDHLEEIEYWQNLARSNPDQLMLWVKLSHALRRSGRESEAHEADRVAVSLAPEYMVDEFDDSTTASEHRLARRALISGDVAGAVDRYRSLLRDRENRPDVWLNLGVLLAASGRVDAAREAWETTLRHAPDHAGARMYLFQLEQPYIPGGRSDEAALIGN